MRQTIIALMAVLAVVGTACTADTSETTTTTSQRNNGGPTGVQAFAASSLDPFASCNEFLDYVKSHAIERVGPYGLDGYGGGVVYAAFEELSAALDSGVGRREFAASDGAIKGVDYSGTNVQTAGVDEPDIVKTDGERSFVVAAGQLHWIDAAGTPEIIASLPLGGWGQQLFLSGDRLLVMTSGGGYGIDTFVGDVAESSIAPGYQTQRVVLTEIDIS